MAALKLAHELGPSRVTIESIATASGVAKTTIYRRWPNAAAVIMDAFLADIQAHIIYRRGSTLRETFRNVLGDLARALNPSRRDLLRHLTGAAQSDPDLAREFWEKWVGPRREEGRRALQTESLSVQEADVIIDLLFGAFYYRLLIPYAQIDDAYIDLVVRMVIPEILDRARI
jgi:AcrR family transcriptional regulator